MKHSATLRERFDAKWVPEPFSGCWLWTGSTSGNYGGLTFKTQGLRAHRISWELHRGAIPEGIDVLHYCDTPLCVNPDHLFLGTDRDNAQDSIKKGRKPIGEAHANSVLTQEEILVILSSSHSRCSRETLAKQLGVNWTTVRAIQNGQRWKHAQQRR